MIRSLFNCHLTYFLICSSSRPTVLTQYPFAQKCLPQYRFFKPVCLANILMALLPFKKPTTSEMEYFGGNDTTKWMWSICTLPSNISTFFHSHSCLIISRTDFPTSPFNILKRYFGHYHTIWYLHSHIACANLLKSSIEYLLSIVRAACLHLKEVFFLYEFKSLPYPHSKAGTTSLAGGLRGFN